MPDTNPIWPASPPVLNLEPGWVHVFRLTLDLPDDRLAALHRFLAADEQTRAARFIRERDQKNFTAARGQLREILAAYTGSHPAALRFQYNPQGKPSLMTGGPQFNLSHSAGVGLLAVTGEHPVGVDIESIDRMLDYANIAQRFFAPPEVADLLGLPMEQQPAGFYRCWTRKEAFIKARGLGLSIPLDSFSVSLEPNAPPRLTAPEPGWALYHLEPGPGFAGALVTGEIAGLRCWTWG